MADDHVQVERVEVTSNAIRSVGYHAATAMLVIEFRDGGVYEFFAVPASVHRELMTSDSPGRYLNTRIRPRHTSREVFPD